MHLKDAPTCLPLWAPSSWVNGEEHPFAAPALLEPWWAQSHPTLRSRSPPEGARNPGAPQLGRQC